MAQACSEANSMQTTRAADPVLCVWLQVEHEPSVPALSVMLLSCLAHGVACMARVVLVQEGADKATLQLLTGCAALVAILLDFLVSGGLLGGVHVCVTWQPQGAVGRAIVHAAGTRGSGGVGVHMAVPLQHVFCRRAQVPASLSGHRGVS
jgi:hypothetical protein